MSNRILQTSDCDPDSHLLEEQQQEFQKLNNKTECSPEELTKLGSYYQNGLGVTRVNMITAIDKYTKAGTPEALCSLGQCNFHGWCTKEDKQTAKTLLEQAASKGHAYATLFLNQYFGAKLDAHTAFSKLLQQAETGDPVSLHRVGYCYYFGMGTQRNPEQSVLYYLRAAKRRHCGSENNLAISLSIGYGFEKDVQIAFQFYTRSAEQGHVDGLFNLGQRYFHKEFSIDLSSAITCFLDAAQQGSVRAMKRLVEDETLSKELRNRKRWKYAKLMFAAYFKNRRQDINDEEGSILSILPPEMFAYLKNWALSDTTWSYSDYGITINVPES